MARTGRPRGKKFGTYLPQTACTDEMHEQVEQWAGELFEGNVGMFIREAVEFRIKYLNEVGYGGELEVRHNPEPVTMRQVEYRYTHKR